MADQTLLTGVAHLGIRVKELARSRVFYELFGFEFVAGPMGPEPVAIMKHPAGIEINFILNGADDVPSNVLMDIDHKHAGYTHVALAIREVDAAKAMLDDAGIPLSGGPIDYPGGAVGMFVRDPDRNVVELYRPAPAA